MADCVAKVFGVEDAFQENHFVLVVLALLFQLLGQPDDVLAHGGSFLVIHDVTPNKQSAPHLLCHHLSCV